MSRKKEKPTVNRVLTLEEIEALIPDVLYAMAWVEAVSDLIFTSLQQGKEIQGAYLVPKVAHRKWTKEQTEVINDLKKVFSTFGKAATDDAVAPRKPLSPAEAEKVIGKANFADLLADKAKAESSGFNLKLLKN